MLERDAIYVWRVPILHPPQCSAAKISAWREPLSPHELRKADAFLAEDHRLQYLQAHFALRHVLSHCLDLPPAAIDFKEDTTKETPNDRPPDPSAHLRGSRRKPTLLHARTWLSHAPDLRFNLSHTAGAALIGVTLARELGVDIEFQRPIDDLQAMACSVMSAAELEGWNALEPAQQTLAFYRLWTRKEAYLKAIGLGLFRPLQEVTVPVTPDCLRFESAGVRLIEDPSNSGIWSVVDIPASPDFVASLSWQRTANPVLGVTVMDFEPAFQ